MWELSPVRHIPPVRAQSVPPSSSVFPGFKPLVTPACGSTRRLGPSPHAGSPLQVGRRRGLGSASFFLGCFLCCVSGGAFRSLHLVPTRARYSVPKAVMIIHARGTPHAPGSSSEPSSEVVSQTHGGERLLTHSVYQEWLHNFPVIRKLFFECRRPRDS